MTPFDEALEIVLASVRPNSRRGFMQGCLANDFHAAIDSPPFDNSQVDGYGVHRSDLAGGRLRVTGECRAGHPPGADAEPGRCLRVFTGARLPESVAAVVMQEDVRLVGDSIEIDQPLEPGQMIRRRGSEYRVGDRLMRAGTSMASPAAHAVWESQAVGFVADQVVDRPLVSIIVTGDEIHPSYLGANGRSPEPGQVVDCVSPALRLTRHAHVQPPVMVNDVESDLVEAISARKDRSDAIITIGGASVGDYDLLRRAAQRAGYEERLWQVAMKPGKPFYFGLSGSKPLFGLPGNPLSALLTFHLLVAPALLKMGGAHACRHPRWRAALTQCVDKQRGRTEFVPARFWFEGDQAVVESVERRSSHMLSGLLEANVLAVLPADATRLEAGTIIDVIPYEPEAFFE